MKINGKSIQCKTVSNCILQEMTEENSASAEQIPPEGSNNEKLNDSNGDKVANAAAGVDPKNGEASQKGKKRKKSFEVPEEFVEKRERRSRGAKTKAALEISLTSMKESDRNYDVYDDSESRLSGGRSSKKGKIPEQVVILSSSPLKYKAGPKSTKTKVVKPGPRSKRRRIFQIEDLYLDVPSIDEEPLTAKFEKALSKVDFNKTDKEKLKPVVPVLDLKNARNPCVKAAYDLAHEYWVTVGQFEKEKKAQQANNVVTVTYQRPPRMNTFQHKPNPSRVIMTEASKLQAAQAAAASRTEANATPPQKAAPRPPFPDPSKPPPVTNYMSVKIEILMNCLEKMYHNHLPLNAFTSRFPNARAKAMLTLMLDGHRAECESCNNILEDANVGVFHGDEDKLKMDLAAFGPAIPAQAPVVDLSQYPDNVAEMKKLLVEKDAKIKALETRLKALNKETETDKVDRLDLVQMLDGVNEPTMDKYGGKFLKTAGYRLIDLRLLRMALEICQTCHHGKMTLAEMSPEVEGNQEDLVTRLAFVCAVCGPKAIFPTSPFSKNYPSNYSLNKLMLPLIGPSGYFHLSEFLQHNPDTPQEVTTSSMFNNQKPQLLVSVDHAFFDFARPFDPPPPTDPDANIMLGASSSTAGGQALNSNNELKLKPTIDLKMTASPASINLPPLRPLEPETNGSTSNGDAVVSMKIKACEELPPGK